MLLEFRTKNYKSFKDEMRFSMMPADKIQDLQYSILKKGYLGKRNGKSKEAKGLCSAVIYGPNSSGKTNLIGAMDVFRGIVLRGNIRNVDKERKGLNMAKYALELMPNIQNSGKEPVEFSIRFIKNKYLINYSLSIVIGKFLSKSSKRKIVKEELSINEQVIFSRSNKLNIYDISVISDELVKGYTFENENIIKKIAIDNLNQEEMFLTSSFKSIFSKKIVDMILDWFENDLEIIYRSDSVVSTPVTDECEDKKILCSSSMTKALKEFGFSAEDFGYIKMNNDMEPVALLKINEKKGAAIPVEEFESFGTTRFMNLLPILFRAMQKGQTVVIDEFDASIHPMALMSIINVFHNDEINKYGAQLIFNTHNPIFLNRNLFRRDEIKFMERDEENEQSKHYSLSDFGTSGPNGVRNTSDYMKNYFINQYGAIRDIDFSDIFAEVVGEKEEYSIEKEVE
jgi:AAA15 family ATPase/GTPase